MAWYRLWSIIKLILMKNLWQAFHLFFKFHFARMKKPIIFALPFTEWNELVAQLVEQYTFNVWALGSSPSGFTL